MRLAPVLASLFVAATALTVPSVADPAVAAPRPLPRFQEYVALGDSWSADVVLADLDGLPDATYAPIDCAQSHRNYPKLLAKELKVPRFQDATCGSATTDDFTKPQTGLPLGGTNPPQFDRLTRRTDLVTVGVGGNDAGFASAALTCINLLPLPGPPDLPLFGSCKERYTRGGVDQLAASIKKSEPKLVRAFREIHRRSPKARILAVNYLAGIPKKGCYPVVPISDTDMAYLYATFNRLNAMVASAAHKGGAELVDAYTPSIGHHVCASPLTRYVEGLGVVSVNGPAVAVPAHPNSAGAASQFRSVAAHLRR